MRKTYGRVLHWLIAPALEHAAAAQKHQSCVEDPYVVALRRALHDRERVSMLDILGGILKLPLHQWTPSEQRRAADAMKTLGWERKRVLYSREWYYERPGEPGGDRSGSVSAERAG